MKRFWELTFLILLLTWISFSCEEKQSADPVGEGVELYLLDTFQTVYPTAQIDPSTVAIADEPLISYREFLSYNPQTHVFTITGNATEKIKAIEHSVYGAAFAVLAANSLIYTGYFWPGYSSASCNWVVIDPIMVEMHNELKVELGYPGPMGDSIPDKRNHPKILEIFKGDHKLVYTD